MYNNITYNSLVRYKYIKNNIHMHIPNFPKYTVIKLIITNRRYGYKVVFKN